MDTNNLLIEITNALVPTVVTILAGLLSWLGIKIHNYIDQKQRDEQVRAIIKSTVAYVEQLYKDLHGEEKLKKAEDSAREWLDEKGIKVSDTELRILIESFVNGLKSSTSTTTTVEAPVVSTDETPTTSTTTTTKSDTQK